MDTKSFIIGGIAGICVLGYFCNKDKKETVTSKTTIIEKTSDGFMDQQSSEHFWNETREFVPPQKIQISQAQAPVFIMPQPKVQYIPQTKVQYIPQTTVIEERYYYPRVRRCFPRGPRYFCPPRPFYRHHFDRHCYPHHYHNRCW